MMNTCSWGNYTFNIYDKDTNFNEVSCIYIYTKKNQNNQWIAGYVGQTEQLQTRINQHYNVNNNTDKCIKNNNYTHIHVMQVRKADLDKIENELLSKFNWDCNIKGN